MHGQTIDEDPLSGLLHTNNPEEMARLTEHDVYGHSGMKILANLYPGEMDHWAKTADQEDKYSISKDGEGRKEGVLALRAKMPEQPQQAAIALTLPQVQTSPPPEPKKGGFFHRGENKK